MKLNEFLGILSAYPGRWRLTSLHWKKDNNEWVVGEGTAIRSYDGLCPTTRHSPLLIACLCVSGYRGHFPQKFGDFYEQGQFLGLSEPDTHAIFRATDNEILPWSAWEDLTQKEQQDKNEEEYQFHRLRIERDYNIRQMLLTACKL